MAGKSEGAAARIQAAFPKAIYTHCVAHAHNLRAVQRNMMDTGESICSIFFNSPKRQLAHEKWINQILKYNDVAICKTRWVERCKAFELSLSGKI